MLDFNRSNWVACKDMGEVRVKVTFVNSFDDMLIRRGSLNPNKLRVYETTGLIDTGAVRTVLPMRIVEQLGLEITGQELAQYADGREESVGVTEPVIIRLEGRQTTESALVTGNDVLIGQTVLEALDLLVDCKNRCLIPNPRHPKSPVFRI